MSASRYSSHLVFDHDPSSDELTQIIGPDFATSYADYQEDDATIRVAPQRIPFKALAIFLVVFFGLLTSAPWILPNFGVRLPPHISETMIYGLIAALWLLIVPTLLAIFLFLRRATDKLGPGAIVSKKTGELRLPWIDQAIERTRILRFVLLKARRKQAGSTAPYTQCAVVYLDATDRYVYAPFANLNTPSLTRTAAHKLADCYDLRLQRVDGGMLS